MTPTPPKKNDPVIKISLDDMSSAGTNDVVGQLQAAQQVPLVRNVGSEKKYHGGLLTLLWMSLAGIGGGALTWVLWNVLPQPGDSTGANLQASVTLSMGVAVVLVAVDSGLTRSWPKVGKAFLIAIPTALVLSLLLGIIANAFYATWTQNVANGLIDQGFDPSTDAFWEAFASQNHLGRGVAWALIGLAAGLSIGISSLAPKRILVTAAGGIVGGFLGGFLFDFFQGEAQAQFAGLAVTGLAIGVSIGLIEQVAKTSWIEIVQGGMAGKQFILYKSEVTVGSSPSADVTLIKDPAIPEIAATIARRGNTVILTSSDPMRPASVNGAAVTKTNLPEGALIMLGATVFKYRQKNKKEVSASIVRK